MAHTLALCAIKFALGSQFGYYGRIKETHGIQLFLTGLSIVFYLDVSIELSRFSNLRIIELTFRLIIKARGVKLTPALTLCYITFPLL